MSIELFTSRLAVRSIQKAHIAEVFAYRQDGEMNAYQGWIPETMQAAEEFLIEGTCAEVNIPDTWHQLVILEKASKKVIGDVGIHFIADSDNVEIGCTLHKQFQGMGYANEALKAVVNYVFSDLNKNKIKGSVDPRNLSSISMLEKLGFKKEAHVKDAFLLRGEYVDDVIYGLLQEEWMSTSTK